MTRRLATGVTAEGWAPRFPGPEVAVGRKAPVPVADRRGTVPFIRTTGGDVTVHD
ncbi:hypothetical protein [Kitasatospora sp. NPDC086791]|uniref:hypothetical protein n=1 Tax=Kitasatospora sp. NPDC086791 TaxID=3155178 RepID=UPI00344814C4